MFIPLCPIRSLDHHLPRGSAGTSWAPFTVPGEEDRGRTDPRTYTCQRTSGCFSLPIASAAHLAFFFLILRKIYFYFYFAMPRGISGLSSLIRDWKHHPNPWTREVPLIQWFSNWVPRNPRVPHGVSGSATVEHGEIKLVAPSPVEPEQLFLYLLYILGLC